MGLSGPNFFFVTEFIRVIAGWIWNGLMQFLILYYIIFSSNNILFVILSNKKTTHKLMSIHKIY